MLTLFCWVVTPCGLVGASASKKHTVSVVRAEDGVAIQKKNVGNLTDVRTSDLMKRHVSVRSLVHTYKHRRQTPFVYYVCGLSANTVSVKKS
jgi:hypothetical protein